MKNCFSDREIKILEFFGLEKAACCVDPPTLFAMAAEKAFVFNMLGAEVESLRRMMNALWDGSIFRGTKEWEDLIILDEDYS